MGEARIKEGVSLPKEPKKKHYWWRYLLTFIGGFVFCIGSTVGSVAILGAVTPAKDVISLFGGDPNAVLGIEYQDSSILAMVTSLMGTKFETLGDVNKVTPLIEKAITESINPVLKDNINFEFDWEELSKKPFDKNLTGSRTDVDYGESLGDYIPSAITKGITLAGFIDSDHSLTNNVLKLFLYPTTNANDEDLAFDYDHPYSLDSFLNGGNDFFNGIIDSIRVGDVINLEEGGFLGQIKDWKLSDFSDEKIRSLEIGPLFTEEQKNSNKLLEVIADKNWTINDLADFENLKSLKVNEIVDLSGASSLVKAIENYTLDDLMTKDLTTLIKIGDIYSDATSGIMFALKDKYICDLDNPDSFMTLKVVDILPDLTSGDMLYNFKDKTLEELSQTTTGDVKIKDIFSSSEIANNPLLDALVTRDENVTVGDLSDYSIISSLKLKDILEEDEINSNDILKALTSHDVTIGSLSDGVNNLTISEVISLDGVDPNSTKYKIVSALSSYKINELADHLTDLTLSDLFNVDSSSPKVLQALKDYKLDELENALDNLTIGDALNIAPGSALDKEAIKNIKISEADDLMDALKNNLTIGDLIPVDSSSPELLKVLENTKLNDLESKVSTMTLGEVITIDSSSPEILKALSGVTLFGSSNNLEYALTHLKFNQVFSESDCSNGIMKTLWDNNSNGDFLISDISSKIQDLPLVDVLGDKLYEDTATKKISATWWMLLTEEGETFTPAEKYYTLKNGLTYTVDSFEKIVVNMQYHLNNDTIRELIESKFITINNANLSKLDTSVDLNGDLIPDKEIGDLTISEFMDFVLSSPII